MSKKILITGGAGFIARSLYENFINHYFSPIENNVVSLSRNELDLMDDKDVGVYLKKEKFDVVIHTANYDAVPTFTDKDPLHVLENNLRMFFNIAQCRDYFGKMIYFGSGAEAGRAAWRPRMHEAYIESSIPSDQYGYSKYIMNKFAWSQKVMGENTKGNIYNIRLFGTFGKFDDWRYRFIPNACCKAVLGMPITIKKDVLFDYLYIDDLIEIVKWVIENDPKRHSYNACSGKVYSYSDLAKIAVAASRKDLDINILDKRVEVEYSADNGEFLSENPDFKFTPMKEAMFSLYDWYETRPHIIDKDKFEY